MEVGFCHGYAKTFFKIIRFVVRKIIFVICCARAVSSIVNLSDRDLISRSFIDWRKLKQVKKLLLRKKRRLKK